MENRNLPGYNSIGNRDSPRTFPGIPLKRLIQYSITTYAFIKDAKKYVLL
jgi:hypothetical protein